MPCKVNESSNMNHRPAGHREHRELCFSFTDPPLGEFTLRRVIEYPEFFVRVHGTENLPLVCEKYREACERCQRNLRIISLERYGLTL